MVSSHGWVGLKDLNSNPNLTVVALKDAHDVGLKDLNSNPNLTVVALKDAHDAVFMTRIAIYDTSVFFYTFKLL